MSEPEHEKAGFFKRLRKGLEDGIAYYRGELSLVTTELPAPPPAARPRQIASLRKRYRMSQSVFAATLNVSTKTVQSWEQGIRQPSDAALRMLQVIGRDPRVVTMLFSDDLGPRRRSSFARRNGRRLAKAAR